MLLLTVHKSEQDLKVHLVFSIKYRGKFLCVHNHCFNYLLSLSPFFLLNIDISLFLRNFFTICWLPGFCRLVSKSAIYFDQIFVVSNGMNKDIGNILLRKYFSTIMSRINPPNPYQFIFIIFQIIPKITFKGHFIEKFNNNAWVRRESKTEK